MTQVLTGTLRGRVITLDVDGSALAELPVAKDRRVRVALEPLDAADSAADSESELLKVWAEEGPQGPIEEPPRVEAREDPDLILSAEEQRRLLRAWAEQGPQGPIES